MPKKEMFLDDIVRFLQEADEDQGNQDQTEQMPPVPEEQSAPEDDQLENMNLEDPGMDEENTSSNGDKPASDVENENPDNALGGDISGDDKSIESTKDDVMDIINKSLKDGKKVNISISNEDVVTTKEYNDLLKKRKVKKLTENEIKKIKKYEKSIIEAYGKNKNASFNEKNLAEVAYALSDRVAEMESQLEGKSILDSLGKSKIDKFNEAVEEFDRSVEEYEDLMESYAPEMTEVNLVGKAYTKIASDISGYRNAISECASDVKSAIKYMNVIRENSAIDEASIISANLLNKINRTKDAILESEDAMEDVKFKMNSMTKAMFESENAMMNLKSKLDFLTEESAISLDAAGFDKGMKDTYYEAPEFLQNKFSGAFRSYPDSDIAEVANKKGYTEETGSFFKLPLAKNAETSKLSTNSAISAIAEAFTDEGGNLNTKAVAPAFLYQKTRSPKKITDFAFPIGAIEEGALVVVPKFVEDTVKILENDIALSKIYKVPESEIDGIRSKLVPYMKALDIEIPWA